MVLAGQARLLWRAGLPRVGLRSSPKPVTAVFQIYGIAGFQGRFAPQREASPLATKACL
jgi:hypothetical protein